MESFDGSEEDHDRRGLLGRGSIEEHLEHEHEHEHDSDDEGVGHTYQQSGNTGAPLAKPTSRLREQWNPIEWGARK